MKWSRFQLVVACFACCPVYTINSKCHLYFARLTTFSGSFLAFYCYCSYSYYPLFSSPYPSPFPTGHPSKGGFGKHTLHASRGIKFRIALHFGGVRLPNEHTIVLPYAAPKQSTQYFHPHYLLPLTLVLPLQNHLGGRICVPRLF